MTLLDNAPNYLVGVRYPKEKILKYIISLNFEFIPVTADSAIEGQPGGAAPPIIKIFKKVIELPF